eukprot:SAG31_NODE_1016_length_10365_cov_16.138418_10_plen_54_part_00
MRSRDALELTFECVQSQLDDGARCNLRRSGADAAVARGAARWNNGWEVMVGQV